MKKRNLTKGNVTAVMLLFAVPMILGNIIKNVWHPADTHGLSGGLSARKRWRLSEAHIRL